MCFNDCSFSHVAANRNFTYDLSALSSVGSIMNGPSFTSKGTKYYHEFNISLCGTEVLASHDTLVCVQTAERKHIYSQTLSGDKHIIWINSTRLGVIQQADLI